MSERKGFTSRLGFILAGAAAAVGIGALWRFPPLVAEHGGGAFLLVYLVLTFTLGFVLLVTEIAIGRKTGKSAILAYGALNRKWQFLGLLAVLVSCIVIPYYSLIGGWVMEYSALYVTNNSAIALDPDFFLNFISDPVLPVIWTIIFIAITAGVLLFGVTKGIQRSSMIIIPFLILVMIGIAVYCILLPGGVDGLAFYFIPDFSHFSPEGFLEALGMALFSLCIASGCMITYGSYLSKTENIEKSAFHMILFSVAATILAGLLIIPAFFSFSGGDMTAIQSGSGLLFTQMPMIFDMMPFGKVIGAIFFICVFFAALTSAIATFEVPVSALIDRFKLSRLKAVGIVFAGTSIVAVIVSFGYGIWSNISIGNDHILEIMDNVSSNFIRPTAAILSCIFIGWIVFGRFAVVSDEVERSSRFISRNFCAIVTKFVAPVCLAVIFCFLIIKTLEGIF